MHEAALAQRPWETCLDGADQPRRAIGDGQQRIGQPPALEVLDQRIYDRLCPPAVTADS